MDWWSLGIVAYEMRTGVRPYSVHSSTPLEAVKTTLNVSPFYPEQWSEQFTDLIGKVMQIKRTFEIYFYATYKVFIYFFIFNTILE